MKKLLLLVCLFVMTTIITAFANVKFDIDEENEEDIKILQEERQKRKEELGIRSLSEDEERYASFFGTKYDIDTTKDVEVAVEFFDNMGYITEPYIFGENLFRCRKNINNRNRIIDFMETRCYNE